MLRNKLVIVLLVLLAISFFGPILVGLLPVRYSMKDDLAEMTVAWRDDEALVFVDVRRTGRRTNVLAEWAGSALPDTTRVLLDTPQPLPSDAHAYHVQGARLAPFDLKNTGFLYAGRYFVSDGRVAVASPAWYGGKPTGYAWDGAAFVPLDPVETERMTRFESESRLDPISQLHRDQEEFAKAGWHFDRMPLYGGGGERRLKFALTSGERILVYTPSRTLRDDEDEMTATIGASLRLLDSTGGEQHLVSTGSEWLALSKQEFIAQFPPDMRDFAARPLPLFFDPMMLFGWLFSMGFWLLPALPCILPFYWALGYRSRTLKTLPDTYDFQPAAPSEFAGLDQARLDELTAALEQLGFRPARDFSVVPDAGKFTPDFSRLLIHPEHHCFAQIVQFFPPKRRPQRMTVVLHSVFNDDWSLSTSPEPTPAMTYRARLPHALWFCVPGAGPAELLEAHLSQREQIAAGLNLSVESGLSFAKYQSYALGRYAERRAALRKRGLLFGPREALTFRFRPPQEWLGESTGLPMA